MTTPHPHILMNNRRRRIQTLASGSGMILQPSGKYGSIKCLPAEIRRFQMSGCVCFCVWARQAAPSPLCSLQMMTFMVTLSRSGWVQLAVTVRHRRATHQPQQRGGKQLSMILGISWEARVCLKHQGSRVARGFLRVKPSFLSGFRRPTPLQTSILTVRRATVTPVANAPSGNRRATQL